MDNTNYTVTSDEFKLFHRIDRSLYSVLVTDLFRDPYESVQIVGWWLWLERTGSPNIVNKILHLPRFLIGEVADEAFLFILCMNDLLTPSLAVGEVQMTQTIAKNDISLSFIHENRVTALQGLKTVVNEVCVPALSDLLDQALTDDFRWIPSQWPVRAPSTGEGSSFPFHPAGTNSRGGPSATPLRGIMQAQANEVSEHEKIVYVTFSKGYPVAEYELRQFFTNNCGSYCIESFQMQEVKPGEQPVFARVVLKRPLHVNSILRGAAKAKSCINGKNVWLRKFILSRYWRTPVPSY